MEKEIETRQRLVDEKLKFAKWPINDKRGEMKSGYACSEVFIDGLERTESGQGYIDNVLVSLSGKPIAIVESKRTSVSPEAGRVQAKDYANALYKKYGVLPVIYLTNGTYVKIDDGIFPLREVSGFHKLDEIERIIAKRETSLANVDVDSKIANRPYQLEAIKKVFDNWKMRVSRSLLVLATGTGKTRVACAVSKILLDSGYAYRILFLADQKNLVTQAKEETFDKYLSEYPMAVMMDGEWKNANSARIVFSTYQTMRNAIDNLSSTDFGIGHFDLIIPDEVHRSIFNKYGEVFNYFDALLLGLTATPKDEVHRSTYKVFNIDNNEPTYEYSLVKAVRDGYLRYYRALDRTPDILRMGLKYDSLSEEEKEQYEELFGESDNVPEKIDGKAFYNQIINKGTIRVVFQNLFEEGIYTQDGKLGKTIIFAKDHKHAETILEVFRATYPNLCNVYGEGDDGADYCVIIDSQIKYNEYLQRSFKKDQKIRIVISVDMMDTGVDVPEIVNLVFFKRVLSKTKFNQMIGRGTRRCDNEEVISPDETYFERKTNDNKKDNYDNKQGFLIFDICGNFEFFSIETEDKKKDSSERILTNYQKKYREMAYLYCRMAEHADKLNDEELELYEEVFNVLWSKVNELNDNLLSVNNNREVVDKFRNKNNWGKMDEQSEKELRETISYLVSDMIETKSSLFVDRISYTFMSSIYGGASKYRQASAKALYGLASILLSKTHIDDIRNHIEDLRYITSGQFIEDNDAIKINKVRKGIRELVKYVEGPQIIAIITDFEDKISQTKDARDEDVDFSFSIDDFKTYDEKLKFYIKNHLTENSILKIRNLESLTEEETETLLNTFKDIGTTKEDYDNKFKTSDDVSIFVRQNVSPTEEALEKFETDCYMAGLKTEDELDHKMKLPYAKQLLFYTFKNGYLKKEDLLSGPLSFTGRLEPSEMRWLINKIASFAPVYE